MILDLSKNAEITQPFNHVFFKDILPPDILESAVEQANQFPFFKIERTRTSNPNRIWLNQIPGILSAIGAEFDRDWVKIKMGNILDSNFFNCNTRAELCMDSVGSWLEPHKDDAAKTMTAQIYLSGIGDSTMMGDRKTKVTPGWAWAFANYNQPIHSLSPLKYNRISIIINYVNDDWRDPSVLV